MRQKNKKTLTRLSQTLAVILLVVSFSQMKAHQVKAIAGIGDITFTTQVADTSWTGILNNISLVGTRLKEWGLDKIAYIYAKRILHEMSVSVVTWVNSGFKGRPAFLTNPQGYFLDAADQVTGELLDMRGPLRNLCSPWSVDIRAALALQQLQSSANGMPGYGRYTCTLGRIINNYRGVNANASVSGLGVDAGINAFVRGDFDQGGWRAFIALTTEDQNNPIGLSLMTRSDQLYAIGRRQNAISTDLQQGKGFLSWESCEDLPANSVYSGEAESLSNVVNNSSDSSGTFDLNSDPTIKTGQDGQPQRCTTKTPGSVIAESLGDQLRTPTDQLLMANDINAIFEATITQLVTKTLTNGLASMNAGSSGSGSGRAYLQSVYAQSNSAQTVPLPPNPQTDALTNARNTYDRAIALVTSSKNIYESAQTCFVNKISAGSSGQNQFNQTLNGRVTAQVNFGTTDQTSGISAQISQISNTIANEVTPLISKLTVARDSVVNLISQRSGGQSVIIPNGNNADDLAKTIATAVSDYYTNLDEVAGSTTDISAITGNAQQDYTNAAKVAAVFNTNASSLLTSCNTLTPNEVPVNGLEP